MYRSILPYVEYYKDNNIPCFEPMMMINHCLVWCIGKKITHYFKGAIEEAKNYWAHILNMALS